MFWGIILYFFVSLCNSAWLCTRISYLNPFITHIIIKNEWSRIYNARWQKTVTKSFYSIFLEYRLFWKTNKNLKLPEILMRNFCEIKSLATNSQTCISEILHFASCMEAKTSHSFQVYLYKFYIDINSLYRNVPELFLQADFFSNFCKGYVLFELTYCRHLISLSVFIKWNITFIYTFNLIKCLKV